MKLLVWANFDDTVELEEQLNALVLDGKLSINTDFNTDTPPIVHVYDAAGNPLRFARAYVKTLSDGTKVYKVVLSAKHGGVNTKVQ